MCNGVYVNTCVMVCVCVVYLQVLALCVVRYVLLERIFTNEELRLLDSILPASKRRRDVPTVKIRPPEGYKLSDNSTNFSLNSVSRSEEVGWNLLCNIWNKTIERSCKQADLLQTVVLLKLQH